MLVFCFRLMEPVAWGLAESGVDMVTCSSWDLAPFLPSKSCRSRSANFTPDGSANFTPDGSANFTPGGSANFTPDGSANFTPDGSANFTPDGSANFTPDGSANFTPDGSANFTPVCIPSVMLATSLSASIKLFLLSWAPRENCTAGAGSSSDERGREGSWN